MRKARFEGEACRPYRLRYSVCGGLCLLIVLCHVDGIRLDAAEPPQPVAVVPASASESPAADTENAFVFDLLIAESKQDDESNGPIKAVSEKIVEIAKPNFSRETVLEVLKEFEKEGKLSVLSRPRIMTLPDARAKILLGNDYYSQLLVEILPKRQEADRPLLVEIDVERRILEENGQATAFRWELLVEMNVDKPLPVRGVLGEKDFMLFVNMTAVQNDPDIIEAVDPKTGKLVTFTVPDGSPQEMIDFIEKDFARSITITQTGSGYDYFFRQMSVIDRAAEKGLAGNPTKEQRLKLLSLKRWAFSDIAEYQPEHFPRFDAFVREIEEEAEKDPDFKKTAIDSRAHYFESWMGQFHRRADQIDKDVFVHERDRIIEFMDENENFQQLLGQSLVRLALVLSDREKDRSIARETARQVTEIMKKAKKDYNRLQADRVQAMLNEHWMNEDRFRLKGIRSDGRTFDLDSEKGKVVIALLWKSKSHALKMILPELKKWQERYPADDFLIVDICTDPPEEIDLHDPKSLRAAAIKSGSTLGVKDFSWTIHLSDAKTVAAGLPSIEKYYNTYGNHFYLIDRDGKVVLSKMPDCTDFESAKKEGIDLTGSFGTSFMKYLTEDIEKKLEELFPEKR